jgi:hypothetical protein
VLDRSTNSQTIRRIVPEEAREWQLLKGAALNAVPIAERLVPLPQSSPMEAVQ